MATPMMTPGMGTPSMGGPGSVQRLPPEVNRILYVRNLPFTISSEELYKIFGDYGAIRQIRQCAPISCSVWTSATYALLLIVMDVLSPQNTRSQIIHHIHCLFILCMTVWVRRAASIAVE